MDYYPLAVKRFFSARDGAADIRDGDQRHSDKTSVSKPNGEAENEGSQDLRFKKKKRDRRPGYIKLAPATFVPFFELAIIKDASHRTALVRFQHTSTRNHPTGASR